MLLPQPLPQRLPSGCQGLRQHRCCCPRHLAHTRHQLLLLLLLLPPENMPQPQQQPVCRATTSPPLPLLQLPH